jgi:hypothetical protein
MKLDGLKGEEYLEKARDKLEEMKKEELERVVETRKL